MAIKKLLIASAGTSSAFAAAEAVSLFFSDEIELYLADINEKHLVSATIFSSNFFRITKVGEFTYIPFMRGLFDSLKPDIVIPFIDQEVELFAGLAGEYHFKTPLINLETAEICKDKYKTFEWLKKHGINTPNTAELENFDSNIIDYIIKPRNGFGSSISAYSLENFNKAKSIGGCFIIQQRCDQPEITIDVFNSKGVFEYVCRERIETKSGVCTKARLFRDETLELLAKNISSGLNLKYFCFQVMKSGNDWLVTDINPRLGSGTPMSKVVGLDFFAAMVADLLGFNVGRFLQYINKEKFVTRQYLNILSK
jgi:hypothetical protein